MKRLVLVISLFLSLILLLLPGMDGHASLVGKAAPQDKKGNAALAPDLEGDVGADADVDILDIMLVASRSVAALGWRADAQAAPLLGIPSLAPGDVFRVYVPFVNRDSSATALPTDTTLPPSTSTPVGTAIATVTPAPTSTPSYTSTSTDEATHTPTPTSSATPTETAAPTLTPTSSATATYTLTPSPTATATIIPSGVITLRQGIDGYLGGQDTYIDANSPDNTAHSSQASLTVGWKQKYATLLRFDLSPVPAGARITRATLQLYATGWSGANIALGAYAISRTVTLSQSTWNQAQSGNPWGVPGCSDTASDRREDPESTLTTSGVSRWYSFDLTSLVQAWCNGSVPNNGVLLRATSSTDQQFYFASSEDSASTSRPSLVIVYGGSSTPTPTTTSTPTRTATRTPTPTRTATPSLPPPPTVTVTLQSGLNGYSGAEDTSIFHYNPDVNYSGDTALRVGEKQQWATLLRFDLSSIPSNAVITRTTLEIYATGWSGTDLGINAYAVLRSTTLGQATWNRAQSGNLWSVAGCENTTSDRRAKAESGIMTSGYGK